MAAQLAAQPFALTPAMVGGNLPIDYTTRSGQSLFNNGIAPLPFTFDGKPESLQPWIQAFRDKAGSNGWDDILTITVGHDAQGNNIERNLLTQFGEISLL